MKKSEHQHEFGRLQAEAKTILDLAAAEDRELTSRETRQVDGLLDRAADEKAAIKAAQRGTPCSDRYEALNAWSNELQPAAGPRPNPVVDMPWAAGGSWSRPSPPRGRGNRYRDVFRSDSGRLDDGGFKSAGDFLRTIDSGLHDPRMVPSASLTEGLPSGGGFLVPEVLVAEMLDASLENEIVRPRCRTHEMTSASLQIAGFQSSDNSESALFGGFSGEWVGEGQAATESEPKVRAIKLVAKKLFLYTSSTSELVADGQDFERELEDAIIQAVSWYLDDALLTGNGAGKPLGVLNDPALVVCPKETSQASATLIYRNVCRMFSRLHPALYDGAIWVASPTCLEQLLTLNVVMGIAGEFVPAVKESNGKFSMLGMELLLTEKLPTLGTQGDLLLATFLQYSLGLRKQMILEKSGHVYFSSDKIAYRAILRADGMGRWSSAFTPKNGDTQSWCVVLQTRS